jgi:hypothetical protein
MSPKIRTLILKTQEEQCQPPKLHALELLEWKITDMRKKYKINNKYPSMEGYYK